jgi:Na+/H+-dicarboxylate symporter
MLHLAIAVGLIAGLFVGLLAAASGPGAFMALALASAPVGAVFLNAIRMVVLPLVIAVIFAGVARLGDPRRLGKLTGTALAFFWGTLLLAILAGMGVAWLGLGLAPQIALPAAAGPVTPVRTGVVDFLVSLIPANPFAAASSGALLPVIVFTALLAVAAGTLEAAPRERLIGLADATAAALVRLVGWILWAAPLGVFGLAAPITAQLGWAVVQSLAVFVVSVIAGLVLYLGVVFLPLLKFVAGIGPLRFLRATFGGASVAFSTTSTVAALPLALEDARQKLGVSAATADVVLPLAVSLYRPGSALFQGAALVFLARLYGVPVAPTALGGALLATFLVAVTVAPVPSSGVVTMAPALETMGIPLSGLAVLLGVDRIPDMFRSALNLLGQIAATVLVDRWVGGTRAQAPGQSPGPAP